MTLMSLSLTLLLAGGCYAGVENFAEREVKDLRRERERAERLAEEEFDYASELLRRESLKWEHRGRRLYKKLAKQKRKLDRKIKNFIEREEFERTELARALYRKRQQEKRKLIEEVIKFCQRLEGILRRKQGVE